MRIDVLTIFPDYLQPLDLSLIGKARREGLLDIRVQDLREHTSDRHRTVDDTPYGGGAGMVMGPEPWGRALDALVAQGQGARPVLVVPGPAGRPFRQELAAQQREQARLAAAVRAHDADAVARVDGQRRVLEEAQRAAGKREVAEADHDVPSGAGRRTPVAERRTSNRGSA